MQPLDAVALNHLAQELNASLSGSKINKIQQASHFEIILSVWLPSTGPHRRQKLYINIEAENPVCALFEELSWLHFPEQAPNFCMVLRKHLTAARITEIASIPDDRVINIFLDNFNELGQAVTLLLSIELMGKHSNIILVDTEINMILGCAHGVSEEMSRYREISVGYPYRPPPKPERASIHTLTLDAWRAFSSHPSMSLADAITQTYYGVGKWVIEQIGGSEDSPEQQFEKFRAYLSGCGLSPTLLEAGGFSLVGLGTGQAYTSLNAMVCVAFSRKIVGKRLQQGQARLSTVLKQQLKKVAARVQELEKTDHALMESLKHTGDLLTLAVSQTQKMYPGQTRLEMTDYASNLPVSISLKPSLTVSQNAQAYYKRYKKGQARILQAKQTKAQLDMTQSHLDEILAGVARAQTQEELDLLEKDCIEAGWLKSKPTLKKQTPKKSPFSQYTTQDGFRVWVGKSAKQNDLLVGKLSYGDDYWLHTHLMPGSHVLLKPDKREVSLETLFEACLLAAYFSNGRGSVNVPVIYTRAKFVRKIPNSYPGHVSYTHEEALNVTPDPDALERLLLTQQTIYPL
jgi:predicted ribosome quality control (RQC) complex YloA/Tae2 family protein